MKKDMNIILSWVYELPGHSTHYVRCLGPAFYYAQNLYDQGIKVIQGYTNMADVCVFQRPFKASVPYIKEAKRNGKIVLFDFDDPLWSHTISNGKEAHEEYTKNLLDIITCADGIVCSTDNLADSLKQNVYSKLIKKCKPHIPNLPPIVVMPNAAQPVPTPTHHNKYIFWGKAAGHKADDEWLEALKVKIEEGYTVLTNVDLPIPHEKFEVTNWANFLNNVAKYAPEYVIAPNPESEECICKSDLKELEAWRLGAKFVGQGPAYSNGIPFNAKKEVILKAFDEAKVPYFDKTRDMNDTLYGGYWATIYSGDWLKQIKGGI